MSVPIKTNAAQTKMTVTKMQTVSTNILVLSVNAKLVLPAMAPIAPTSMSAQCKPILVAKTLSVKTRVGHLTAAVCQIRVFF